MKKILSVIRKLLLIPIAFAFIGIAIVVDWFMDDSEAKNLYYNT